MIKLRLWIAWDISRELSRFLLVTVFRALANYWLIFWIVSDPFL